ncbi:MAG TPA: c-type cytochrome, partial [Anaerolineales bacterium]|nr:c-type cytochrome [Anaerolineales bacterium]
MHKTRWRRPGVFSLILLLLALAWAWPTLAQTGDDQEKLELGARLFAENCAVCHGPEGQGRVGATLAKDFPSIRPDLAIETTIANGVAGSVMPAWGQANGGPLTGEDIHDLAAYIVEAFGGTQPITPLPTYMAPSIAALPEVEGDPSAGAVVYQENCVMCHGAQGEGRFGAALAKAWPSNDPATYIRQVVSEGIQGSVMPTWGKAGGGPLTDENISDVAAFVLTLKPGSSPTAVPQ